MFLKYKKNVNTNPEYAASTLPLQYAADPLQMIWTEMMQFVIECCCTHTSLASLTFLVEQWRHT